MMKDKLVEGYGFIGTDPNTLYKFGNGKYKTFEGTEISIENCMKAKVKDLVVEGKTIQDTEDLSNIESVTEKENNILSAKINDNTTTLNLPIPLRSLPNGVADTIEGNKLVQRVGKVVLDGSLDEEWGTSSVIPQEETMIFQSTLIKETVKPNSCLLSNKFNQISDWNDTETITMGGTGNVRLYIGINRNKLDTEDLKGFKKWLSENPVTVYYELAEPIIHDLEIPQLATTRGTNVITAENNIKPKLKLKVKVKK